MGRDLEHLRQWRRNDYAKKRAQGLSNGEILGQKKNCEICGKEFYGVKKVKCCSHKCGIEMRRRNNEEKYDCKFETTQGYIYLSNPQNSYSVNFRNRILEHRYVMEQHLGGALSSFEIVHHKNANRKDNRIENLEIVLRTTHQGEVRCPHCLEYFKIK